MIDREFVRALMLWVWVGAALAAYLYQYLDMVVPIMRAFGLS